MIGSYSLSESSFSLITVFSSISNDFFYYTILLFSTSTTGVFISTSLGILYTDFFTSSFLELYNYSNLSF
jgi:hypothetical protein